ncbi:calcitonin gene-related peptide type 1 receptor-like [Physella acuta]|uniref:calcitonin gene-related peptide type 1 receptor-like n=1 Tax=Physella acuta TaxID=109671 RepID=UPI0027DAC59E|nr:calcitonin gene-related peptide type 1 receptor-like [Physella acuta]
MVSYQTTLLMVPEPTCRDRYNVHNVSYFQTWTCFLCFSYLFPDHLKTGGLRNMSSQLLQQVLEFDVEDQCKGVGELGCSRLRQCCQAAKDCCEQQVNHPLTLPGSSKLCPMTWDGFACFHPTPAGHTARVFCPWYIAERTLDDIAEKTCTENGTWWREPGDGQEWTDYTNCVSLERYRILYLAGVSCNICSIVCLLPGCAIFLTFRQLRNQHRIRIHLNLFVSFTLTNAVSICWDHVIFRDRLENSREHARLHQNIAVCRVLYVLLRYSWACNFLWMSLEGFHLYRLINHAFHTPKSIVCYYFVGWLLPCVPIGIYSAIRGLQSHPGCWVNNAGTIEWILYGPNLTCILLNLAFLLIILRILVTQIQTHRNEPSNYRRALKATFILVPLFGLHLFLIVYRPGKDSVADFTYEVLAKVISHSQGALVAVIFCFLNGEVHSQFGGRHSRWRHSNNDVRSCTFSTGDAHRQPREGTTRRECIPLSTASGAHTSSDDVISCFWPQLCSTRGNGRGDRRYH